MAGLLTSTNFIFPHQQNVYHGKVRDVYTLNDQVVMVATDRISAFDYKFPELIPHKGQVLNQIAAHFLNATRDVAPNWLKATPDPNVAIGKKCEPVKIEVVMRGALLGSAWRSYAAGERTVSGVTLPEGLSEYHLFETPVITPTTKSEEDEPITYDEILEQGLVAKDQLDTIYDLAHKLFARGQNMATERGLVLADTKYEFGLCEGEIVLMDEIHTPDSSRYFYKESYDAYLSDMSGEKPRQLSKEFFREWLLEHNFSNQPGEVAPALTQDIIDEISARYIELYETITGKQFVPDQSNEPEARIEKNINTYLEQHA